MAQRNLTPDTRDEQDAAYDPTNPSVVSRRLQDAETDGAWTTADQDQYDATVRDSGGESGDALRDREQAAGASGAAGNAMNYSNTGATTGGGGGGIIRNASRLKKFGPLGVTIVLVIGGAIVSTLSFPMLVLQHIEETLTSALNDADPSINARTRLSYKLKVDAVKNGFAESTDGKCSIKCKFSTINNKTRKRMEAASGVKFEVEKKGINRYVIKSATFPAQGTKPEIKVTNGDDFANALKDPVRAAAFYKVFNPGSDPFLANNWVKRLAVRFNLSKKATLNGDTEKENRDQLARNLGTDPDANIDGPNTGGGDDDEGKLNDGPSSGVGESISSGKVKLDGASKLTDVAGAICAAYDVGKAVNAAYSVYKVAQYTVLFNEIVKASSEARTGKLKPATVAFIGGMVTNLDMNSKYTNDGAKKDNPFYKKSFTDSAGYKMAAYGDNLKLTERDKTFSLNPTGVTGGINQLTSFMIGDGSTTPAILAGGHATCAAANNPLFLALSCLPEAAAGSVAPVVGNAAAFIGCVGLNFVIGAGIGIAIQTILPGIISDIVKNDIGTITENLVGPGLGNATYVGAGEVLGSGMSSMYGLTPGTSDQIQDYKVATAGIRADYARAEKAAASDEPLNVYNQYSFLGSMVRQSGILDANLSTPEGTLNWVGSLMGNAAGIFVSPTYAVSSKAELYNDGEDCPDAGLREIGAACNAFGLPSFTMSNGEMNADIIETADWMLGPNGGAGGTTAYIDDDGNAIDGTDYAKFVEYCSNRQVNYGQTTGSISDDDFGWETGYNCVCNQDKVDGLICTEDLAEALSYFRTYTMDKTINDADDDDEVSTLPVRSTAGSASTSWGVFGLAMGVV